MKGQVFGLMIFLLCLFNSLGWAGEGSVIDDGDVGDILVTIPADSKVIVVDSIDEIAQYAKEHKTKCRSDGMGICTLKHCGSGYYDENGEFKTPEPCNSCAASYYCDDGAQLVYSYKSY